MALNNYPVQVQDEQHWSGPHRHSGFFVPSVISIVGALVWLIYILLFTLYWSKGFSFFQDLVVLIATLFITVLVIGLMWLFWGKYNHAWNF